MARTSVLHPVVPLQGQVTQTPGVAVEPFPTWQPPKGLNYLDPLTRIEKEFAPEVINLWLDRGVQRSRYGTSDIGAGVADLMAVMNFIDGSGVAYLIRFTTTVVQAWDGVSWNTVYSGFTGGTGDKFTFTSFNDKLIFSNGIDGLFEYDFSAGTVTLIVDGPSAKNLTTFDGRVIASDVIANDGVHRPSRVMWSVKNNHKIWHVTTSATDEQKLGSGFEDLLSTPGGQIDQQRGVWPITDTISVVVRSKSVWQMTVTGNFDAPFRFDRLFDNIGTDAGYSIDTVPGGIIGLFNDDIYVISNENIQSIGAKVKDRILAEFTDKSAISGMFDPLTKNYWLTSGNTAYRFSFNDQGWTKHVYPFTIRQLMHTRSSVSGLTIDQLVGTIDGLVGSIDSLVGTEVFLGNFFATAGATGFVVQEDPSMTDDTTGGGGRADSPIETRTTMIQYGGPLLRSETIQAQLEYEAEESQVTTIEYSMDGGATWAPYSTLTLGVTAGPGVAVYRKTFDARLFQLRLTSTTLGALKIIGFTVFGMRGAPVNL